MEPKSSFYYYYKCLPDLERALQAYNGSDRTVFIELHSTRYSSIPLIQAILRITFQISPETRGLYSNHRLFILSTPKYSIHPIVESNPLPAALKRLIQDWIDSVRERYPIIDTSPIKLRTRPSRHLVR